MAQPQQQTRTISPLARTIWQPGRPVGFCDLTRSRRLTISAIRSDEQESLEEDILLLQSGFAIKAARQNVTVTDAAFLEALPSLLRGTTLQFAVPAIERERSLVLPPPRGQRFDRSIVSKKLAAYRNHL